jgi:hypothetical protein
MAAPLRLAVFLPEFKWARMNLSEITAAAHGVELVAVDLGADLAPFDGVLHKFTYELAGGRAADVERVAAYARSRPGFLVIEPIDHIRAFTDRLVLQELLRARHEREMAVLVHAQDGRRAERDAIADGNILKRALRDIHFLLVKNELEADDGIIADLLYLWDEKSGYVKNAVNYANYADEQGNGQ